jgi:hypothetical protein
MEFTERDIRVVARERFFFRTHLWVWYLVGLAIIAGGATGTSKAWGLGPSLIFGCVFLTVVVVPVLVLVASKIRKEEDALVEEWNAEESIEKKG